MNFLESGNKNLDEFIQQFKEDNPRIKLILDYMEKMKSNSNEDLEHTIKYLEEQIKYLEERNNRLLRSYKILIERNELCSSALGMCGVCWGTSTDCDCKGKGGPGSRMPDINAFNELILPVLKIMNYVPSKT